MMRKSGASIKANAVLDALNGNREEKISCLGAGVKRLIKYSRYLGRFIENYSVQQNTYREHVPDRH